MLHKFEDGCNLKDIFYCKQVSRKLVIIAIKSEPIPMRYMDFRIGLRLVSTAHHGKKRLGITEIVGLEGDES